MFKPFAVLALSALALTAASTPAVAAPPFGFIHLHSHAVADTRIHVTFYNGATLFRDVEVNGQVYTVSSHQWLDVKAPAGTVVYAASSASGYRKGDALVSLTPQIDNTRITLN